MIMHPLYTAFKRELGYKIMIIPMIIKPHVCNVMNFGIIDVIYHQTLKGKVVNVLYNKNSLDFDLQHTLLSVMEIEKNNRQFCMCKWTIIDAIDYKIVCTSLNRLLYA
jgi:hypothetical protein